MRFHCVILQFHLKSTKRTVEFLSLKVCIFSRNLENQNWVFPTTSSYGYGRTSARRAQVPVHNCMNEWLGEPVLGFQLPGRGILGNFINKVVI